MLTEPPSYLTITGSSIYDRASTPQTRFDPPDRWGSDPAGTARRPVSSRRGVIGGGAGRRDECKPWSCARGATGAGAGGAGLALSKLRLLRAELHRAGPGGNPAGAPAPRDAGSRYGAAADLRHGPPPVDAFEERHRGGIHDWQCDRLHAGRPGFPQSYLGAQRKHAPRRQPSEPDGAIFRLRFGVQAFPAGFVGGVTGRTTQVLHRFPEWELAAGGGGVR